MREFALALTVFLGAHSVPALPRIRSGLVGRFGRGPYLAGYSAISVVLLAWLILAARHADTVVLWEPARWQWFVPLVVMPVALFLGIAGLLEPNPLSISLRAGTQPGAVAAITRHPLLWGFLLWALAHIPPNGDLVSVLLFSGLAAFSLAGFFLLDAKAKRRLGRAEWDALKARSSIVPFAALLAGRTSPGSVRSLVPAAALALGVYVWFLLQGHALLIGLDPLASLAALG